MSKLLELIEGKSFAEVKFLLESKPYSCKIKEDEDYPLYFMVCYNQIESDFNNEVVRECRGIILTRNPYEIVCRPFDKFGNYGEGYVPDIDWDSARVQEKIDGSLIKVWWSEEYLRWMISTNGMIDAYKAEIQNDLSPFKTFGDLFKSTFFIFRHLRPDCTTMFEVVSPWTRIVVQYKKSNRYHLGTRHNKTGQYFEEPIEGYQRPIEFKLQTIEDVVQAARELPFNHEGYVVVDKDYNRLKVKSPAYVAVHHLKNNGVINRKRLLDLILLNEIDEFITYFPEYRKVATKIDNKFFDFMYQLYLDVNTFLMRVPINLDGADGKIKRKEFAMWATKTTYPALMFSLLDGKIKTEGWREHIYSIDSEKLLKIIDKFSIE